ncbi:uncharacterized protein MELLADRAFT_55319 [Melampsora larici-populina 98AG31]|uniref:Uncharacterized protein n=1 Tax=Melampsora larici-populina (strain 98AG31 / pathotype 3-4-7) TaxID=747676 RepID=F4RD79_MELLP|nr:uncharacterized protein MELLADRAFT_55319 [Melampsora larici-populina 98AG31]EGG09352.1 hypothetical protein MELLADRAFT_55319 [Melampsora larici-populina 98AG31]
MCHVINLVAKDFLDGMGQLTDEDIATFETSGMAKTLASFEPDELPCTGDYSVPVPDSLPQHTPQQCNSTSQASLEVHRPTQTQDDNVDLSQITYEDILGPDETQLANSKTTALTARKKKSTIVTRIRALDTHIRKSPQELEASFH